MTTSKLTPFEFFYEHAGYGYDPAKQTEDEGRRESAQRLADAERWASDEGYSFEWEVDQDIDSSDFDDSPEPWALWVCVCRNLEGEVTASLCGIDFGRDGEPWGDYYRRVAEAELALETMPS
jgi:hypothetical protein